MRNSVLILTLGLLATTAGAQDPPQVLNNYVYINNIEEHKVTISAPLGFGEDDAERENLYEWANWACGLYLRHAVGPLSQINACLSG